MFYMYLTGIYADDIMQFQFTNPSFIVTELSGALCLTYLLELFFVMRAF